MMDLEEAYPGWGTGKAEEFISYDEYTYKDESRDAYTGFIYDDQVSKIQKDEDVTKYFINWDRDWVRMSMPPCIGVSFTAKNFETLKSILKEKYNVTIKLENFRRNIIRKLRSYEHALDRITKSGLKVEFTPEIYEKFKEKDDPTPLEDLVEYKSPLLEKLKNMSKK
jgi:hypothetical protein